MILTSPIAVRTLAERFSATLVGNAQLQITGINEIHKVNSGDLTFVDHPKYYQRALNSAASVILIDQPANCPDGKALLVVAQPWQVYDTLVREVRPLRPLTASIHASASIGERTIIEPGVVIGPDVRIGSDCYVQANAYIGEHCLIGNRVTIQSGAILGTDAFYYKKQDGKHQKWRSGGRVVVEDDVEIGAACTINRGVSGDTLLGKGTKLDSQVHLGHGVVIGKHCLLAAQVGIGGKTIVGDYCVLYGKVGVSNSLTIADHTTILGGSNVTKSIRESGTYFGYPAAQTPRIYRELAALRQLPDHLKDT